MYVCFVWWGKPMNFLIDKPCKDLSLSFSLFFQGRFFGFIERGEREIRRTIIINE